MRHAWQSLLVHGSAEYKKLLEEILTWMLEFSEIPGVSGGANNNALGCDFFFFFLKLVNKNLARPRRGD